MRTSIIAGAVALACLASHAFAATEAECNDMFKKADINNDGVLTDAEASRYLAMMRVGNINEPTDKRLTSASFMEHCQKDLFKATATEAGAPLKGANSFTEGQARDRALAHGYTDVTGLKKDDDGIWRGMATMDGKSVGVAIDYKGNVVSDAASAMPPSTPTTPANPATNTTTTTPKR